MEPRHRITPAPLATGFGSDLRQTWVGPSVQQGREVDFRPPQTSSPARDGVLHRAATWRVESSREKRVVVTYSARALLLLWGQPLRTPFPGLIG